MIGQTALPRSEVPAAPCTMMFGTAASEKRQEVPQTWGKAIAVCFSSVRCQAGDAHLLQFMRAQCSSARGQSPSFAEGDRFIICSSIKASVGL